MAVIMPYIYDYDLFDFRYLRRHTHARTKEVRKKCARSAKDWGIGYPNHNEPSPAIPRYLTVFHYYDC